MSGLVLSLFPGIGLLDRAFEEEGFCVVRGPDLLWGGDIHDFHPPAGIFDGVIGGPPCQAFSAMKRINPRCGYRTGNLIPEYERCVREAASEWFVMENVEGAPVPAVDGYIVRAQLVRDVWVGGETNRLRRISFGTRDGRPLPIETLALHRPDPRPSMLAGGSGREVPVAIGGNGKRKKTANGAQHGPHDGPRTPLPRMLAAQGLPTDWLDDCSLTMEGKRKAVGNGVPLPMGRAIARAVKAAL